MPPASTLNITLSADVLQDDEAALRREWLVTNGLGGYASASVATANTRRYHGLLVAALHPPVGRAVLLSKLEESLDILGADGGSSPTFALSANLYPGVLYPQGHHLLESWEAYPAPGWVFSPQPGVRFQKRVWMAHGHNTTYAAYRLLEAPPGSTGHLHLVPLLAWKDYHSEMHAGDTVPETFWFSPAPMASLDAATPRSTLRVTLPPIGNVTSEPTLLNLLIVREDGTPHPDAAFDRQAYWYYRFQHPREQERGLDYEEDLYALGMFSVPLAVGETVVLIATTEAEPPAAPQRVWADLLQRQADLDRSVGGNDDFTRLLARAADTFVVQAPGGRATVIAGYHWFADWGRDTMISLPGLCLTTGHAAAARDILLSFATYLDRGMLPNRFPDKGETPEYNTVDATLWYFAAIYHYVLATGDLTPLRETLWSALEQVVQCHQQGTRYNIHVDPADHLLYAGEPGVQLTWMDARIGNWVVTPRIGKPVEINALWHNALRTMAFFATQLGDADEAARYTELARQTADSFTARFPRPDGRGLFDVLDTPENGTPDSAVRPNQIFALSLPFAPLEPAGPTADTVLAVVREELVTEGGVRTLSPHDPAYRPRYEGDPGQRDSAYHQGTAWPWLLGPFAEAHYKRHGDKEAALAFLRPLQAHLRAYGLGSLAEVFDGDPPQRPNGCIAQAWSVAETLRVWRWLLAQK